MQKIYLAGSCGSESRTLMCRVAAKLRESDYEVYCPFEFKVENAWDMSQEDWARKVFENDLSELNKCDIFLLVSPGRNSTAGSNWEQGYAYAKGKEIVVVQYTEDSTSLMTYCSANNFINSKLRYLVGDAVVAAHGGNQQEHKCKTILT